MGSTLSPPEPRGLRMGGDGSLPYQTTTEPGSLQQEMFIARMSVVWLEALLQAGLT